MDQWFLFKSGKQWVANAENGSGLQIQAPNVETVINGVEKQVGSQQFYISMSAATFALMCSERNEK